MINATDYGPMTAAGVTTEGTVAPDKLFDRFDVRRKVTIASGQGVLARGSAMGKVTATGKWKLSAAAAGDGSEVVRGILLDAVDATAADVEGIVGRIGRCNGGAVTFGAGHTLASVDDDCLDRGLILETVIG
jgi:hypothetical protein